MSQLRIQGLTRRFPGGERNAVNGLDLDVDAGEVVCLVGPSGCGKSTTLRLVAGLDEPDSGRIEIGQRDMHGVPPQERDVAMVFQGFALYPHLRVREILAFPLKMRRISRSERERTVTAAAELLGLTRLLDRRPAELSGGEQQRVAMGRAIVRKPQVFLFDEPLSNLDAALRAELRIELGKLLRELRATALYVTHDQVEAMSLGQRIAVLRHGNIEQLASPKQIYESPASAFVAGFFGNPPMNLLAAERRGTLASIGPIALPAPNTESTEILLGIRPEHVQWLGESRGADVARGPSIEFSAQVVSTELFGAESHIGLDLNGELLKIRVAGFEAPRLGETIQLAFAHAAVRWFDKQTGRVL